jgi:hypothetical protein
VTQNRLCYGELIESIERVAGDDGLSEIEFCRNIVVSHDVLHYVGFSRLGLANAEAGLIEAGVNDNTGAEAMRKRSGGEWSGQEIDGCRKAAKTQEDKPGETLLMRASGSGAADEFSRKSALNLQFASARMEPSNKDGGCFRVICMIQLKNARN